MIFVTLRRIENTCTIRSPSLSCSLLPASTIDAAICLISLAMLSGVRTISTKPVAMAFLGMPSNLALSGDCTMITPFLSLMERIPFVPSDPVPDRITATALFS